MLALDIGKTVKWATDGSFGEQDFPVSQSTRTSRYQNFVRWLDDMSPDAVCYFEVQGDVIYNKFLEYLLAWCAENEVKHKGFQGDPVRKYTRRDADVLGLYKFAMAHRW